MSFSKILFLNKTTGFSQRSTTIVRPTKFLPPIELELTRSSVTQSGILKDLLKYEQSTNRPDDHHLKCAIATAHRQFSLPKRVSPYHLLDVFQLPLDIWDKSPGLPWVQQGYRSKSDVKKDPDAVASIRAFWSGVKKGHKSNPWDCQANVRSHIVQHGETKMRAVWGYPMTMTMGEAQFALPLIQAYQSKQHPIAYGYETAIGGMVRIHKRFSGYDRMYYALDFKSFDKTVPAWLIREAFSVLFNQVDFTSYHEFGDPNPFRLEKQWQCIVDYFINTPIRTATGLRFRKSGGIASGSYFTQLIGSICNFILLQWAIHKFTYNYAPDITVFGDDSLFYLTKYLPLERFSTLYKTIGMSLNESKSQVTPQLNTIKFLGYQINSGEPTKDRADFLAALFYPEKPDFFMDEVQSRALGLFYANMGVDKWLHVYLKTIVESSPFDLIISREFSRKMLHLGIDIHRVHNSHLPNPEYFWKFFY